MVGVLQELMLVLYSPVEVVQYLPCEDCGTSFLAGLPSAGGHRVDIFPKDLS